MKPRAVVVFVVLTLAASLAVVAPGVANPGKAHGTNAAAGKAHGKSRAPGKAHGTNAAPGKAHGKNALTGTIIIEGLTLAGTQFGTPSGQPTTVATDPVSIPVTEGDTFTYSTITCATAFPPWNSFGLHFEADYPRVDEGPTDRGASVRHELRGTVTKIKSDGTGKVRGTITTILCWSRAAPSYPM